jgi:gluconolactonase
MSEISVLAEGLAHPEGPDFRSDGALLFVETYLGRISIWDREGGTRSFAQVGGGPNACMLGTDALYVTQNGGTAGPWRSANPVTPSIQKVTLAGQVEVVTTTAGDRPLQGPNDLTFGPDGRLYFTDPGPYDPTDMRDGIIGVIERDGTTSVLAEVGPTFPNGIVAKPDGSLIWGESYTRDVKRRRPDGSIELLVTLPEGHVPDGMKVAANGDIYISSLGSRGIDVIADDGTLHGFVHTGGEPQNLVFLGRDLYVTDFGEVSQDSDVGVGSFTGRILRVGVGVEGLPLFRGAVR